MVTLSIRSMFVHHNAHELRDARLVQILMNISPVLSRCIGRTFGKTLQQIGHIRTPRVTRVTFSMVSSTSQVAFGSGRARFRRPLDSDLTPLRRQHSQSIAQGVEDSQSVNFGIPRRAEYSPSKRKNDQ